MKDFSLQPSRRRDSVPESTSWSGKERQGKAKGVEAAVKIIKMEKKTSSFFIFFKLYFYNDKGLKTAPEPPREVVTDCC